MIRRHPAQHRLLVSLGALLATGTFWFGALPGCSGDGSNGGNGGDGGDGSEEPPDEDPADQYVGICNDQKTELDNLLCPSGGDNCDPGCDFYISADGDDANDGTTQDASWATLAAVETALADDGIVAGGASFCFRRGDTFAGEIEFAHSIHASADEPVILQSYGSADAERPIFSGARVVTSSWSPSGISSAILLTNLEGTLWEGESYEWGGENYTPHEKVYQLFVDGEILTLARFPSSGEGESTIHEEVDLPDGHYSLIDEAPSPGTYADTALPFDSDLHSAIDWTGASLIYRSNRWLIRRAEVTGSDSDAGTFTTSETLSCDDDCRGFGYMMVDHLAALDAPGEWFYDAESKELYVWPLDGMDLSSSRVELSVYQKDAKPPEWASEDTLPEVEWTTGIDLQEASGVQVRGLHFAYYSGAGLSGVSTLSDGSTDDPRSTTAIEVLGSRFSYTGTTGVNLSRWGDTNGASGASLVSGNSFVGQQSQAVIAQISDTEISCNDIQDIGRLDHYPRFGMAGNGLTIHDQGMAVMAVGDSQQVLYNRIARTSSAGISFRNRDAQVSFNTIRDACYTKADCGGVHSYTWDDGFMEDSIQGSVVSRNIVLDARGPVEGCGESIGTPMAQGLFMDFGSQSFTVRDNVVAQSTSSGVLLQKARSVLVRDNLFFGNNRFNISAWEFAQIQIISHEGVSTDAEIVGNTLFANGPQQRILGVRNETASEAATYSGNGHYHPYAYDCDGDNGHYRRFMSFDRPGDVVSGYHRREWQEETGEEADVLDFYWHEARIDEELSESLIDSSFDSDIEGWTKNEWSSVTLSHEDHPELGSCLKFELGPDGGGGSELLSPSFAVTQGKTYEVRFWIAADPEVDGVQLPLLTLDEESTELVPMVPTREVAFVFTASATEAEHRLVFSAYPYLPARFWLDDVVVTEVSASSFEDSAVVRYSEELPSARSVLVYNDTDEAQQASLPSGRFFSPDGEVHESSVEVASFGGVVLVPERWATSPQKE